MMEPVFVKVTPEKITLEQLIAVVGDEGHGAQNVFSGVVRSRNHGRDVVKVSYDAHAPLAQNVLRTICEEARQKWEKTARIALVHRVGELSVGESSVMIVVSSKHRDESYKINRYILEELKTRAPIWKKETYTDGESQWLKGHALCSHGDHHAHTALETDPDVLRKRYLRQSILEEIGWSGQQALMNARVLMIGAGGLGSACLPYLAGAGIGTIGIVDGDKVDETNLHRQVLYGVQDIGMNKSESAKNRLRELNPFIKIHAHAEFLDGSNSERIFSGYDLVIDGTDNFDARYLINDAAVKLSLPVVSASCTQLEGQASVYWAGHGPCYRCVYPEKPSNWVPNCAESGVLGPVVGMMGMIQAIESVKLLTKKMESTLLGKLMIVDAKGLEFRTLSVKSRPGCGCQKQVSSPEPGSRK